jgi:hypothetical protein
MDTTAQARLLAVDVLMAEPELLGNDALEGDLYILREELMVPVALGQEYVYATLAEFSTLHTPCVRLAPWGSGNSRISYK